MPTSPISRFRRLALALAVPAASVQTASPSVVVSAEGKVHADAPVFPDGPAGESPGLGLRRAR
jgi:hypothetical protein